jgi:serine/threonine-protein kinase
MKKLIEELHRRSLWQVLGIYLAGSWIALQVVDVVNQNFGLPDWVAPFALILLVIGLPIVLATAFVQEGMSGGAKSAEATPEATPASVQGAIEPAASPASAASTPDENARRLFTWRNAIAGGVLAFSLLFGFAGLVVLLRSPESPLTASNAVADEASPAIAVLPFDVSDSEHQEWREELVYLLSTNLDAVGGLRAIDSRTVLVRWEGEVGPGGRADLETALRVARDIGARHALLGSAISMGSLVRLAADIHATDGGQLVDRVQIEGSPDSIFSLVDRLSIEILRSVVPSLEGSQAGIDLTESPAALKAFLEGEAQFSRSEWAASIPPYEQAVAIDSTFALAYYRLSLAYGWEFNDGQRDDHHESAVLYGDRLPERERLLVGANFSYMLGDVDGALRSLEAATRQYPDDPEAWYMLGETILHLGPQVFRGPWESEAAFRHTVDLDPSFSAAHHHLVDYAIARLDESSTAEALAAYEQFGAQETAEAFRIAVDIAFAPDSARPMERVDGLSSISAYQVMYLLAHPSLLGVQAEMMSRALANGSTDEFTRNTFALWNALTRGQWSRVNDVVETLPEYLRGIHLYTAWTWGFDVPSAVLDAELDRVLRNNTRDPVTRSQIVDGAVSPLDFALQAWAADSERWDDFETLMERGRHLADTLRAVGDTTELILARTGDSYLQALEGYAAWRRGDPETALREMQEAERHLTGWGPNHRLGGPRGDNTLLRFWIAEILLALGRPDEAQPYFESMANTIWEDWPPSLERLAQIHDQAGELDRSAEYYARFVELWADADEELQPRVQAAQARLEEIVRERG